MIIINLNKNHKINKNKIPAYFYKKIIINKNNNINKKYPLVKNKHNYKLMLQKINNYKLNNSNKFQLNKIYLNLLNL
jgi:hypothetical protein